MTKSFLNYPGGKFRLLSQFENIFPSDYSNFIDLFAGSAVVSANMPIEKASVLAYDKNELLIELLDFVKKSNPDDLIKEVEHVIGKYNLSNTNKNGYNYYSVNSNDGLSSVNKKSYLNLRKSYNEKIFKGTDSLVALYVLIVFGFNNQMRFNSKGEFNNPVGKRDFNKKMQEKLVSFHSAANEKKISFASIDFRKVDYSLPNSFFYVDPPYLITTAVYNENDGWNDKDEIDLLNILDEIAAEGNKFALSNVLRSKGLYNEILINWIAENKEKYKVHHLNTSYTNSNYQSNRSSISDEVLITNY